MSQGHPIVRRITRRQAIKSSAAASIGAIAAPFLSKGRYLLFADSHAEYSSRAVELVGRTTVIDMLSPFAISPSRHVQMFAHPETFTPSDIQQFRSSGIRVFHIAIGNGGPDAYTESLQFFGLWNGFIAHHGQSLMRIDSLASFDELKKSEKIGVLLGLQNSEHFRGPDDVDLFFSLGQRVSQLTYNSRNLIGNGSTERRDDGISDFGIAIVQRMHKLGMTVDVSHCGDRTTLDSFEISKKPVLITHANCRALVPHPRCKTDEAIKKMAAIGGVMGITGVRMFVKVDEPTTIEDALNHFDHVAKLVGVEHVGVGSDVGIEPFEHHQHRGHFDLVGHHGGDVGRSAHQLGHLGLDVLLLEEAPLQRHEIRQRRAHGKHTDLDLILRRGGHRRQHQRAGNDRQ